VNVAASRLLAVLVVTASRGASAEPPPIVRVFVAGSPDAVSGMRDALQDQCARPNLAVMVEDAASADAELLDTAHNPGLADAYVDLRPDNETRIVVVDGQTHEQLEGRTLGRAASLDVSIEIVAQVVCSAIDSTLAARAAAAAVATAKASTPAPPPLMVAPQPQPNFIVDGRARRSEGHAPSRRERASVAWVGAYAVGADYGAGLQLGGGGVVGASVGSTAIRFGGALLVDGFPSLGLDRQGAQASLDLYGARLLPTLEWDARPQLNVFAGLGGGVDWLRVSTGNPPAGAAARTDASSVEPMLSSLLGAKLGLGLHVSAWLALGADLDLARHSWVNEASGAPALFYEAPRVRPVVLAGLAVTLDHEMAVAGRAAPTRSAGPQ
jgi:hypothetical protein